MMQFVKNAMDWILEKEKEAANQGIVHPEDVAKQIEILEEKRKELHEKFEDEDAEFAHVLSKLRFIEADALKMEQK